MSNNLDVIYLDTNELIFCMKKIFVFSLILIISLLIIILNFSTDNTNIEFSEKFQISSYAIPIILGNVIIFSLVIINKKNKLPVNFKNKLFTFFQFELSKKISIIVISIFIIILIVLNLNDLQSEETFADFHKVQERVDSFADGKFDIRSGKYFLLYISDIVFQNVRVVPLIASISLMIMTYLFTVQISQKRFAGLISMGLVLQSNLFLTYSSTSTYGNFWILFYLVSLYLINRKWFLSPVSFIFSIFTKYLTPLFLPVSIYHIARSKVPKNKKIILLGIYLSIPVTAILFHITGIFVVPFVNFDYELFATGFKDFSKFFVNDSIVLIFLIPVIYGLFVMSKRGLREAETVLLFILIMLFSAPLITGFFALNNHPYRFIPLVVFFSIGTGILFSSKLNLLETSKFVNTRWSYVIFIPTLVMILASMISVVLPNIIEGQYRLSLNE